MQTGKYKNLFQYFRQCPQLSQLWSIAAEEQEGVSVILPVTSTNIYSHNEFIDTVETYHCENIPALSIDEDFQINCYVHYDPRDNNPPRYNSNVLTIDEVQSICDWVEAQNVARNFPDIGEDVVFIECLPPVPQIRYVDEAEQTACYYITIRIRYVNKAKRADFEL